MNELERQLRETLRREPPPEGFADRVMSRVSEERRRKVTAMPPRWAGWAVAASLLVGSLGGGAWYREQQERTQAEEARRQILTAMKITGETIAHVRAQVQGRTTFEE